MHLTIEFNTAGNYILVTQTGKLSIEAIRNARQNSTPFYADTDRALVDYRDADFSAMSLIDIDSLGMELKSDLPGLRKMALIYSNRDEEHIYRHIENVSTLSGVHTRIFRQMDAGRRWLLTEGDQRGET